ncbi:MAG: hypothetical protein Q7T55_01375 [Solirubrobacteraceae bacterium]|nr:hypothetical protein [Solirubrobacteraceae bacterium]
MARTGSITVAALLGTGFATIGFALSGVSALGDDLQAARTLTPAPVLKPGEEEGAGRGLSTTPAAGDSIQLEDVCDRSKRRGHHGDAADATTPTTPDAVTAAKSY